MRVQYVFLIPVVLLATSCIPSRPNITTQPDLSPVSERPTWTPYINQDLGFELAYPNNWTREAIAHLNVSSDNSLFNTVFAISETLPATDQYGDRMATPATFSIATVNTTSTTIHTNYAISGLPAHLDIQDGPNALTIYRTIEFALHDKLIILRYTWSAIKDGGVDSDASGHKQSLINVFNDILASFKPTAKLRSSTPTQDPPDAIKR